MDQDRFAQMTRRLAAVASRRESLRALAGGVAAIALGFLRADVAAAAVGGEAFHCRIQGKQCNDDNNCCTARCRGGVCVCRPNGSRCQTGLGRVCCSGKCQRGRCRGKIPTPTA